MKKRILTLVALMLCVVTVLASCATTMKFEDVVGDAAYEDENPTLTAAKSLAIEGDQLNYKGDLVAIKKYDEEEEKTTYTVYNLATDATVYTVTVTEEEPVESDNKVTETKVNVYISLMYNEETEVSWFMVKTLTKVKETMTVEGEEPDVTETETVAISLCNAKGEEFANYSGKTSPRYAESLDLICFDNTVYRIAEDGSIAKAFDVTPFTAFPSLQKKQGNYYYTQASGRIAVYDAELTLVAYYQAPSYVEEASYHVLNDGNVLIQYTEYLGEYADDYDFTVEGERYDLYSFLLDVEENKTKELKLDYYVVSLTNQAEADNWLYSDDIENVAWIYEIVDERLSFAYTDTKMVSMNNKAKIKGEIAGLIPNQAPEALKSVAPDRWVAQDLAGNKFLLNGDGEVMGNVNGLDLNNLNAFYLLINDKIYDWDLNMKYDLNANEAEVVAEMNHGVLMTNEDGETLFYANGAVKTLVNKDAAEDNELVMISTGYEEVWVPISESTYYDYYHYGDRSMIRERYDNGRVYELKTYVPTYSDALFIIATVAEDESVTYKFYNDLGNVVLSVSDADAVFESSMFVCTADSNGAILIRGEYVDTEDADNNKTVYYRVG